jgi:hypothetical protein
VDLLEADHEVGVAQVGARERVRPVGHEVEAVARRELERLRERVSGGQVHRPERADADREAVSLAPQDGFRDRAAEAIAAADDHDVELVARSHSRRTLVLLAQRRREDRVAQNGA